MSNQHMTTVFILGAGFSAHAGVPLMNNFFDKAQSLYYSNQLSFNESEAHKLVSDLRYQLSTIASKANIDIYNLESVFELFEMARFLEHFPLDDSSSKKTNHEDAINSLIEVIVSTIERTCLFQLDSNKKINVLPEYDSFFQTIRNLQNEKQSIKHDVSFITLNYDMIIETALEYSKVIDENDFLIAYKRDQPAYYYGLDNHKINGQLPLYKLHGSLNWVLGASDVDGKYYIDDKKDYMNAPNFRPSVNSQKFHNLYSTESFISTTQNTLPLIVPPTWNKIREYEQLKLVWKHAFDALTNADNIVIIGYSLPDSDQVFKRFFSLAMSGKKPIRKILITDPNMANILPRFKKLLGNNALQRLYVMPQALGDKNNIGEIPGQPHLRRYFYSEAIYNFLSENGDKGASMIKHYTEFEK